MRDTLRKGVFECTAIDNYCVPMRNTKGIASLCFLVSFNKISLELLSKGHGLIKFLKGNYKYFQSIDMLINQNNIC